MNDQASEPRKFTLSRPSLIFLAAIGVLTLLLVVLSVMYRNGIALIQGEVLLFLPFIIGLLFPAWGLYALHAHIRRKGLRIALTLILGLALFMLLVLGFSYLNFVGVFTVPRQCGVVRSPDGAHTMVVLRQMDGDPEHMEVRRDARLAADPEADPELGAADYTYIYAAYPRVAGMFYSTKVDTEGEIRMGYTSEAKLMVEWLDDNQTAHFFIENPEPGDEGEWTVRF